MSSQTSIEWTDATWNPVRGCTRVSEGCRNCYAERMAARFSGLGEPYEGLAKNTPNGPRWTGRVVVIDEHLNDPTRWRKPRMVFVNSMSDLFHESLSNNAISRVFLVMEANRRHTFQVLTKRPERVADWFARHRRGGEWPSNVWIGTSIEDQKTADERIPHLVNVPATTRFLSVEPLLGPVDITRTLMVCHHWKAKDHIGIGHPPYPLHWYEPQGLVLAGWKCPIHWVIVGGESGPGARRMDSDWARSLRDQCAARKVPFFMKQIVARGRKVSFDEWPEDLKVREWPTA